MYVCTACIIGITIANSDWVLSVNAHYSLLYVRIKSQVMSINGLNPIELAIVIPSTLCQQSIQFSDILRT